jgi:hypothetical protein
MPDNFFMNAKVISQQLESQQPAESLGQIRLADELTCIKPGCCLRLPLCSCHAGLAVPQ